MLVDSRAENRDDRGESLSPENRVPPAPIAMTADFLPTAELRLLKYRAELLLRLRETFNNHGYWEVETPLLSHESVVDAHLDPFVVEQRYFLQTSPELGMKRLLTAGADAIFQITRAFRRGEYGQLHNPEFTMAEWYRSGDTYHDQMDFVEQLIRAVAVDSPEYSGLQLTDTPFPRRTYDEVFCDKLGCGVLDKSCDELRRIATERQLTIPETLGDDDRDGWLNLLIAELVEPHLGRQGPDFVYDYPASQAALARIDPANPLVAQRFELYIHGLEICNGYDELTDPDELRQRIISESAKRAREGLSPLPEPRRLLAAMECGLPNCSGVALGFDRLMMVLTGSNNIADVTAFPITRA
ncbi:Elongation factor P--(R)-beta-lysine ligase [Symmachiella macrocystis]|uniref:Elongation factor P--(R)-beta-lysine ligase n=1 Tax=Symmachiella macrocystis TaxID=2527985 RepID=A0A5C6BJT5_9PLAN|nr:EF-P lysine aminoacylase EpmA [Symmachiella macrocystis]TWU11556.1 Elongation factor P--(R)-beta-lysine ligase [Symmachiella macrocystis]